MQWSFDSVFKIFHYALKNANILIIPFDFGRTEQRQRDPNCICGGKNRNLMKLTLTGGVAIDYD
jgi:hypothetical protein